MSNPEEEQPSSSAQQGETQPPPATAAADTTGPITPPPVSEEEMKRMKEGEDKSNNNNTNKNDKPAPKQEEAPPVLVTMNDAEKNLLRGYPDNFIKTSKYSWWSFVPMNLIDQFRKVSNFYFLINMVIALIPGVSPITPFTAVLPLIFVVGVALIKDGYEEYQRHQADNKANSIKTTVVRKDSKTGKFELTEVESREVMAGDIMQIRNGEEIRADVLLLSSTGVESSGFIDTCNLDGETNLKSKKAVPETWHIKDIESALAAKVEIATGEPSPALHHWTGVVVVDGKEVSVGLDQFLYRSCVLKNTEFALGVVLYAGVDTKMFRNLEEKPPKMSGLDIKLNWLILAVLALQISLLIILASISVAFNAAHGNHWYMKHYVDRQAGITLWGYRFLTYFILMSYLIPISLFVTLELCKVAQASLMSYDHEMFEWMNGKWQHCIPNTSNLNEQLSQVKFIFSDKTGTLTENVMKFKLGDALGLPICADDWSTSLNYMHDERMQRYMRALALCHTIQPFLSDEEQKKREAEADADEAAQNKKNAAAAAAGEKEEAQEQKAEKPLPDAPWKLKYDGASPDEIALVHTAIAHGVSLTQRFTRSMCITHGVTFEPSSESPESNNKKDEWEILATLEFTPDRKMMSIVVRNPNTKKIEIYTKGADSFVIPHLNPVGNEDNLQHAKRRLKEMASTGLRTLMVCYREIDQAEFDDWQVKFIEANKALENRSQIVDKVCLMLEHNLMMVGLTAIEDKLQDKVPDTIQFFLKAGVVIWMLTGDKRETALTIADTSSLTKKRRDHIDDIDIGDLSPSDDKAISIVKSQLDTVEAHCSDKSRPTTFVIDGPALTVAMTKCTEQFIAVSQRVASAVCCRLTPLQKANVVKMFQEETGLTALAIGDGANDVPMISQGKVGVGIVGLEGAQAALAADYAIPRFKHLKRLCMVHGRYALVRNAFAVFVSFYKNFVMAFTQFYYAFFVGFSGQTLYDGWLLSFYNFAFTSLPPLLIGMFEKDMPEKALMHNAELFPPLADGIYFNWTLMCAWFGEGIFHSLVIFFVAYPMLLGLDAREMIVDGQMVGSIMMSCIVGLVLLKLCWHVAYWQWIIFVGIAVSVAFYILFIICYSWIPNLIGGTQFYWSLFILMGDSKFWLYLFFFFVGLLCPVDLTVIFIQKQFYPDALDKIVRKMQNKELELEERRAAAAAKKEGGGGGSKKEGGGDSVSDEDNENSPGGGLAGQGGGGGGQSSAFWKAHSQEFAAAHNESTMAVIGGSGSFHPNSTTGILGAGTGTSPQANNDSSVQGNESSNNNETGGTPMARTETSAMVSQ